MTKPKNPAKPGAKKSRAAKKAPAAHDLAVAVERELPPNLKDGDADMLFAAIEDGMTVKLASMSVGLLPRDVYKWRHRHAKFSARIEEALAIVVEVMLDDMVEDSQSAHCRDTAAGAKERREARMEYLRARHPSRFNVSPFRPNLGGGGADGALMGVILVPMKASQEPAAPIIDGTSVRVPAKQLAAG